MTNSVWNSEELSTVRHRDVMLPSQPYFTKMYNGNNYFGDLEELLYSMYPKKKWDIETKPGMTYDVMGSHINTLRFLQMLIRLGGHKKVLELGTYIGVSAMYMADAGPTVQTVEKGWEFFQIAKKNISRNGFQHTITPICMDASVFLETTNLKYDFILIDCAKESYKNLLEFSIKCLSYGGLILVDDVFFQGDTLNDTPTTEKGRGVFEMLQYANTLDGWEKVIVPIGNGLLLMRKS